MTLSGDLIIKVSIVILLILFVSGILLGNKKSKTQSMYSSERLNITNNMEQYKINNNQELNGIVDKTNKSLVHKINDYGRQGFTIGFEHGVLLKNPHLLQQIHPNVQVIIANSQMKYLEELVNDANKGFFAKTVLKSIELSLYNQKNVKLIDADDTYIQRLLLNPKDYTERSVAAYIKEQERNLIHLLIVGYKCNLLDQCKERGLIISVEDANN